MGGVREQILVGQLTLDELLCKTFVPDLVKIDVEGAEIEALRSASRLLGARPKILVEVNSGNATALTKILHDAEYRLFDASHPLDAFPLTTECAWHTLAVPSETCNTTSPVLECGRPAAS
jgi:hypothetical protein